MGIGTATGVGKTHSTIKCEFCGMTMSLIKQDYLDTKCYEVFGDSITTMLKRIHGNVKHKEDAKIFPYNKRCI